MKKNKYCKSGLDGGHEMNKDQNLGKLVRYFENFKSFPGGNMDMLFFKSIKEIIIEKGWDWLWNALDDGPWSSLF